MGNIIPCNGFIPLFSPNCFIAPNATLIGDIQMEEYGSVWFNAVIRGDVNSIRIGKYVNIQDGVIIHGTYLKSSTTIHDFVSIAHGALIHGCSILDHVLVGMGSIVMDKSIIEPYCIIGAGSLILEKTVCESGFIYAGSPVKKIKPVSDEQRKWLEELPLNYVKYSSWFNDL